MKRTLNPTGKIRLTQDQVWADLTASPGGKNLKIGWDLSGLDLGDNLEMIAEIFASDSLREVVPGHFATTGTHSIELGNALSEGLIRFTLRLVDPMDPVRRITAETASIFLNSDASSAKSLLKTQPNSNLPTLWAVDFALGEPVLQILNQGNSYRDLTSSRLFLSAVLPTAVEKIVELVITEEDSFEANALTAWEEFFVRLGLASEELSELRVALSNYETVEVISSIRQRSQEVAKAYSIALKFSDISMFDKEV